MTTKKHHVEADPSPELKTMLSNIGMLAGAMNTATGELTKYLNGVAREIGGFEKELERLRGSKQAQLDELDAEIADKTQRHKGLENSIKTLKEGRAAILTQLEKAATA
jgi:hypothetical protein